MTRRRAVVYGVPAPTVQRAIAALQPEYLTFAAGFRR
jgi:hypothetical protein